MKPEKTFKADLFIAVYFFCLISAELLGAKSFPIANVFGYQINGAVGMLLIPFIYSINDIFFEVYGRERAKNLAKISLIIVTALIIVAAIAVSLPATARFAPSEAAYNSIFSQSIRISIASLIALACANLLDVVFFAKLKEYFKGKKNLGLWFRNILSNLLSLFIDTFLFMTLAFYSLDQSFANNLSFLMGLILPYWLLKFVVSTFGTPIVYWGVNWLKKSE